MFSKRQVPTVCLSKFLPREMEIIKFLNHENIIKYFHCIETDRNVYIVMELAPKGSLVDVISSRKRIDEVQAKSWMCQILNAVDYCHAHHVAHRDIKCDNILLSDQMTILISDFGFARIWRPALEKCILCTTFCGSIPYASLEVMRGQPYDPFHADVWSIGIVLYVMVFGVLPYSTLAAKRLVHQKDFKIRYPAGDAHVSQQCKDLIESILVPANKRLGIGEIRASAWLSCQPRRDIEQLPSTTENQPEEPIKE